CDQLRDGCPAAPDQLAQGVGRSRRRLAEEQCGGVRPSQREESAARHGRRVTDSSLADVLQFVDKRREGLVPRRSFMPWLLWSGHAGECWEKKQREEEPNARTKRRHGDVLRRSKGTGTAAPQRDSCSQIFQLY